MNSDRNDLILNAITEGVHVIDAQGRIIFENSAAVAMFGWPSKELIGRPAHVTIHHHRADGSPYPPECCPIYRTLLDGQTRESANEVFFRCDGSSFPVEYTASAVRDNSGAITGVAVTFNDVTKRMRADEAIRDYSMLLSNAQRIGRMGSWSLDIADERMQWSDETCALFGIEPADFRGTREHFYEFVLPEDRPRLAKDYARVVASEGLLDVETEFRIRRPDGEVRWMFVRGNAKRDASGRIGRRFGMYMDITERKHAEERILRLNRVYALFSELNAAMVRVHIRQQLFDIACEIAVETGKMRAAWIGLVRRDNGHVEVVSQAGKLAGYLDEIRVSATPGPDGDGPFGIAMREGRPVICNDTEADPSFAPWRDSALRRGFRSLGVFPLTLDGRTLGGFVHYSDIPGFFDDEEVHILNDLASNISFAVESIDREERRLDAEVALRQSEARFRAMYEQAAVGICLVSMDYRFRRVNKRFCEIVGYSAEDLLNSLNCVETTHPDDRPGDAKAVADLLAGATSITLEKRYIRPDRQLVWARLTLSILRSKEGDPQQFIGVIEDISERRSLEEQLRRSQRLESIGQLTGGVAHDFNNLLTVILGGADLLASEAVSTEEQREVAELIATTAERGADLTRRLLAFARRQSLNPTAVDVNQLIHHLVALQRRTLGENIEIDLAPAADLWHARVDPAQLESALLNLTINARDAMPDGGRLTIGTANVSISAEYAQRQIEVQPGQYVQLSVSDTGGGIDPAHLSRVFEPFFTTKETGKGTGLGLAMVYGFIRQSGGHVDIYSELGHGTTVKLYLPRTEAAAEPRTIRESPEVMTLGCETILMVEDDEQVRRLTKSQLVSLGYRVIEAANGPLALEVIRGGEHIDLLFTDMMMPGGLNGGQLASAARQLRPGLKILYTSGYAERATLNQSRIDPGAHLLAWISTSRYYPKSKADFWLHAVKTSFISFHQGTVTGLFSSPEASTIGR